MSSGTRGTSRVTCVVALGAALFVTQCKRQPHAPAERDTVAAPSSVSAPVQASAALASSSASALPVASTSSVPVAVALPPPEPTPIVARACAALLATQRRVLAGAWGGLEAPAFPFAERPETTVEAPATGTQATAPEPVASAPRDVPAPSAASATSVRPIDSAPLPPADWSALDALRDVPPVPEPFGRCLPTHDGAWMLVLDEATREEQSIQGRWSILHIDRTGKVDSVQPSVSDYLDECGDDRCMASDPGYLVVVGEQYVATLSATVFDWNADGKDELFVHLHYPFMGGGSAAGRIWTFRKRTISLYPPARHMKLSGLSDVDTDGRPDVLLTLGSGVRMSPCTNQRQFTDTLTLAGHALADGKFSFDDDVAVRFAKSKCAAPERALSTQVEVLCARVWGLTSERVAAALERGCKAQADVCDTDCEDQDALSHLIHTQRVPVVIPANAR